MKKDLIILTIGSVFQVIIALLAIKILTVVLDAAEVGSYYLLLTILTLLNFSFLNPLGQYYGRHVVGWGLNGNLGNATIVLIIARVLASFVALIVVVVIYYIFNYSDYYNVYHLLLFVLVSLLAGTFLVLLNTLNSLGFRFKFVSYMLSATAGGLILSLIFVYFIEKSAIAWIYGTAVAQVVLLYPIFKEVVKDQKLLLGKIKVACNKEVIKKVNSFILPVTIVLFLQWGLSTSYRLVIEERYALEVLGYIALGLAVTSAIFSAVETLAVQFYNPRYLKRITNSSAKERQLAWNHMAGNFLIIFTLLSFFVLALAPYLVNILVAGKYSDVYIYTTAGVLIEFFRVLTNLVYKVSHSELTTKPTIMPYLLGFLLLFFLMSIGDFEGRFYLIPIAIGIAYFLVFVLLYKRMKGLLPISFDFDFFIKSVLFSMPFGVVFLFEKSVGFLQSGMIVIFFGIYFLAVLYYLISDFSARD